MFTVPTAMVSVIAELDSGVLVYAQHLDPDPVGPSFGRVTAEALLDAGAAGVMLNHSSNPVDPDRLPALLERAQVVGLATILCADTPAEAVTYARLGPTAVLVEPPALIGTAEMGRRTWIPEIDDQVRSRYPKVLLMHAGGVSAPATAESIMALGADGTGATSGVLTAQDPLEAARSFIAATRTGWDAAHPS